MGLYAIKIELTSPSMIVCITPRLKSRSRSQYTSQHPYLFNSDISPPMKGLKNRLDKGIHSTRFLGLPEQLPFGKELS